MTPDCNRRTFLAASAASVGALLVPAARAAPAFNPTRFSVEAVGNGPDVILIPGLGASRNIWRASAGAVPGYRYHLVQLAGFAGDPARGNARGPILSGVVDELAQYIAARRLVRPRVVGHSMGGTIGLMLALRRPGLVGKLMVVDMLPQPAGLVGSTPERLRTLADQLQAVAQAPGGRALVASMLGMFGAPRDSAVRSDPDVVARALHELALTDLGPRLPAIAAPTTILYASPDATLRAALDRTWTAAYRALRGARLVRIDNSGHLIMAQQPARFVAELRAFLAGH